MSKRVSLLSAAIAALMLPAAASATNGYFTHGFGVRSQAVAGVGIALAQDSLTAANNPAGIALVGNRLDIGASYFRPSRGSEIVGNRAGANGSYDADDSRFFVIPEVGYVRELNEQLTAGLAIYGNGGMNTDYGTNPLAAFGSWTQDPALQHYSGQGTYTHDLDLTAGDLNLAATCFGAAMMSEQLLRTLLWHLDRLIDLQPRLGRAQAIAQVCELTRQLQGRCEGHQVEGATVDRKSVV